MNNKNMQYIRLMNFNEEANAIVNKAIQFSRAENCSEINTIHLFLALVEKTDTGKNILELLNTDMDGLYNSYKELADNGVFGTSNGEDFEEYKLDNMTKDLFIVLGSVTAKVSLRGAMVSPSALFDELLSTESEALDNFLFYIGTSREAILDVKGAIFEIPEMLEDYVVNMNDESKKNSESIANTKEYTDKMIEVLSRKLEANPCLVGQAGVGKTTLVRAFVQRILSGDVPSQFANTNVIYINSSLLTSGTRYRGDFEERMKCLIDWASKSDVILFLDEIHTFINLNSNGESAETAGNMIKKALSDGDIRIIGATTDKEYHKFIEKDSAFDRRLQVINVKEPSIEDAISMIKGSISNYSKFHNVDITEKCIESAVKLSDRYIKDKALPAKAYKVLDQAATIVKLDGRKVTTPDDILHTVSNITGINVNRLDKSEAKQLLKLEDTIGKKLIGQENAVRTVCKAIRRSKAGVREEGKPLASFLFVGPTGVGKTELCKVLSDEVAIGDNSFIKVDMSEFSEKYSTSKMIGTAPGYVGYGEGGQLTEKVKHNPYSLILFDEIEKAHPDTFNIFLQLLDEGRMTDGEGNTVDFTNCIIVMTSNAGYGAEKLNRGNIGFASDNSQNAEDTEKIAMEALKETFKPEFLNRLDNIVVFDKLNTKQCKDIVKLMLNKLSKRIYDNNEITVRFADSIVNSIAEKGFSDEYGARNLRREIQNTIEDILADEILSGTLASGDTATVSMRNNKIHITRRK